MPCPIILGKNAGEYWRMKQLEFHPLTPDRWQDVERLFGERGASGGCWCMWWKLRRSIYEKTKGSGNKKAFKQNVASGQTPGILAYRNGEPVGWCAVEPRESYPVLGNSRILAPVDTQPVWSVVCFFIAKPLRHKGMTVELLKAAVRFARNQGAKIVEGYPVDPKAGTMPDAFLYHGLATAFRKAGFKEAVRRSETRPVMRHYL